MIMKNRIACRICLNASADVKFCHMNSSQLRAHYEEIINEVLAKDDELLNYFCYQCSAMLQKYHSFRQLCIKSQESLKRITAQNLNISFDATLKWEQYNNKIHPLIKKLDSTAKLGYFEYEENDITVSESFDDPLVDSPVQYAESLNPYFDNEQNFESNCVVGKHNFDSNNDTNKTDFEEPTKSNNVDKLISSVSEEKRKSLTSSKVAKNNSNLNRKKKKSINIVKVLDETKWKTVILSNEEALKEFEAQIQKQVYKRYKHICEHCQRAFADLTSFNKHMYCHSEASGNYECFFCKKRYIAKYKLNLHMRLHLVKYHCLQCSQVFCAKNQTTQHEKYHEGVQYACPLCDIKFQQKSTFYGHLRIIHRSSHLCQYCGASFINQSGLRLHKTRVHKMTNDTGDTVTYCEKCDMAFESPQAFAEHERNSVKHVTEEEDVLGQRKKLLKWNPQHNECDKCAEQFSSTFLYNRHMQRVHNAPKPVYRSNRPTVCEICGATVLLNQLPIHMNIHDGGKRFPCPDCDKVYNHFNNMKRHRRDPTPFSCELCGKKFSDSTYVRLHVRTVHLKQPHPPRNRKRMKFASLKDVFTV